MSTHSNVIFSHANTLPPEYRPSVLKRKIANKYEDNSNAEPIEARQFDANKDREHLDDKWIKFSKYQSDHASEYFYSN